MNPTPDNTSLCPSCGYDIRGLNFIDNKATCPECGAVLDRLSILQSERYKEPSILRLIKIPTICGGVGVMVLLITGLVRGSSARLQNSITLDAWSELVMAVTIGTAVIALVTPPIIYWRENRRRFFASRASRGRMIRVGLVFCGGCSALVIIWAIPIQMLVSLIVLR